MLEGGNLHHSTLQWPILTYSTADRRRGARGGQDRILRADAGGQPGQPDGSPGACERVQQGRALQRRGGGPRPLLLVRRSCNPDTMTPSGSAQDASHRQLKPAAGRTPRRRWGMLVVVFGSVVVAALGGFLAVLLLSDRRQEASEPAGVQSYENLSRTHLRSSYLRAVTACRRGSQPRLAERWLLRGTRTQRESRAHHGAWCCVDHLLPRPASGSEGQAEAACREPGLSAGEPLPRLAGTGSGFSVGKAAATWEC